MSEKLGVKKLNRAKEIKNDEYYTLQEDVIRIFNKVEKYVNLKNMVIDLPFDSTNSFFYKEAIKRGFKVNMDGKFDYKNFKYSKNGIVISNPPFSIYREIIAFFIKNNIKFVLIAPLTAFSYTEFIKLFNKRKLFYDYIEIKKFYGKNNELLEVPCFVFNNIESIKLDYWKPTRTFKPEYLIKLPTQENLFEEHFDKIMTNSFILEGGVIDKTILYTMHYLFYEPFKDYAFKVMKINKFFNRLKIIGLKDEH